jgi:hypothetical protein
MAAHQLPHSVKAPVKLPQQRALDQQVQKTIQMRQELFSDALVPLKVVQHALGDISYAQLNNLIRDGRLKVWRVSPRSQRKVRMSVLRAFIADRERENGGSK